jgi:iron complex transport system substrate-binding protein
VKEKDVGRAGFEQKRVLAVWLVAVLLLCFQVQSQAVELHYATGFEAHEENGVTLLTVHRPWVGATADFHYLLKKRGEKTPPGYEDCQVVEVPVRRMVVLSTPAIGFLAKLDALDTLVGFSAPSRVNSEFVQRAVKEGRVVVVGEDSNLRVEKVLSLSPEIIFTFATGSFRDAHPKLLEAGLKVAMVAEYMEKHPLGRAEWIKYFGLFLGKEVQAEKIFNGVEQRYNDLAEKIAALPKEERPTVITGAPFNGEWYVAGGRSFLAHLFGDAGADYLWKDSSYGGAKPVDVEMIFARGQDADFWFNPGSWNSVAQGRAVDPRFQHFKAMKERRIYNNNRRISVSGGNDYWESGVIAPDVILADMVSIFHPGLVPDHALYYYTRLPEK